MVDRSALARFEPRLGHAPGRPAHLPLWRQLHVLRTRRAMRTTDAAALWEAYLAGHGGNIESALGELVRVLVDAEPRQ